MDEENFNELEPKETEVLALLSEECGELVQIIGKTLRHGLFSHHPDNDNETNRDLVAKEIGDVQIAIELAIQVLVIDPRLITDYRKKKVEKLEQYLHHVNLPTAS